MAALVAAIPVFEPQRRKTGVPGPRPGMTDLLEFLAGAGQSL
jgi:hypothetical protein